MTGSFFVRHDDPAEGGWNMAADEWLGERLPAASVAARFYGWSRPTISIGAFQPRGGAASFPAMASLPLVRRPSGGGAILHGTDLTYAIAVHRGHPWGEQPSRLYDGVHAVAATILRSMGLDASLVPDSNVTDARVGGAEASWLCFDRRSPGDVVVGRHKVLGSAQRRHRATVVQHGSLLLRSSPSHPLHAGIEELLGRSIDAEWLRREWARRLGEALGLEIEAMPDPPDEGVSAAWAASLARYRGDEWTSRR